MRIIAPDRPGYGQSDPKPGRTLLDWANDVMELADVLKITTFAIVGVSGGGPGALACAWKIPERITSVGVVSCAAHGRPWGFPLNQIKNHVHFWFCGLDRSVPPAMGQYLSHMVPNCKVTLIPDAGHLWILSHINEVLTALM